MATIAPIDIINHDRPGYIDRVGIEIRHHAIFVWCFIFILLVMYYIIFPSCITEAELSWIYQQLDRVSIEVLGSG